MASRQQVSIGPIDGEFLQSVIVSSSAGGNIPAPAGQNGVIIRIYRVMLVLGGTTNITFQDGSTALSGAMPMLANGSFFLPMDGYPHFTTLAGNAFNINSSTAVQVSGTVWFTILPTATPYNAL